MRQGWWGFAVGCGLLAGCALTSQTHQVSAPGADVTTTYGVYYRAMAQQGFEQVQGDAVHGVLSGTKQGIRTSVGLLPDETGTKGVVSCTRQGSQIPIGPATVCDDYLTRVRRRHD